MALLAFTVDEDGLPATDGKKVVGLAVVAAVVHLVKVPGGILCMFLVFAITLFVFQRYCFVINHSVIPY